MVGFLPRRGVEASCSELAKCVEDGLSGGVVADVDADVVGLEEGAETGEVAVTEECGKGLVGGDGNGGLVRGGRWFADGGG